MSTSDIAGEQVEVDRNPDLFKHQLEQDWAKNDPYKWKQLAILTLIGNGWPIKDVARSLDMNKNHLYRVVKNAKKQIKQYAEEQGSNIDPSEKPHDN